MTAVGTAILAEVNIILGLASTWAIRTQKKRDKQNAHRDAQHNENQRKIRRLATRFDARFNTQDTALQETTRALTVMVESQARVEKRVGVVEERVTGMRETSASLRAAVDLLLATGINPIHREDHPT